MQDAPGGALVQVNPPSPERVVLGWILAVIGLLFIAVPFVLSFATIPAQLEAARQGIAPPASSNGLLLAEAGITAVITIVLPGIGLLVLASSASPLHGAVRRMVGGWRRMPEGEGVLAGLSITPALFVAIFSLGVMAYGLTSVLGGQLPDGDDNRFRFATLPAVIAIAVVAGIGEEFLYRGILQGALTRLMGLTGAILVQAVLFGVLHAGYGNWISPITAGVFGLMWGLLMGRLGLLPLVVGHAAYDVIVISFAGDGTMGFGWALLGLLTLFAVIHSVATRGLLWRRVFTGEAEAAAASALAYGTLSPPPLAWTPSAEESAAALRAAGHTVCSECRRYPVLPGAFSERTGRCQVCAYRWLAQPGDESNPRFQARIEEAQRDCDRIVAEAFAQARRPPPF